MRVLTISGKIFSVLVTGVLLSMCRTLAPGGGYMMTGPGDAVKARLSLDEGQLVYSVTFQGEVVILPSPLGIVMDGDTIGCNAEIRFLGSNSIEESYRTRGFHSVAVNKATEYEYSIRDKGRSIRLQFRLMEDGAAYRYLWDEPHPVKIGGELSSFRPHVGIPVWFFERPNDWKLKTYAGLWTRTVSDSLWCISPVGPVQGAVLLYELPSGDYMALTEAALYHYSGMRYRAHPDASLTADFSEGSEGFLVVEKGETPWRVIQLSKNLDGLVSSDILTNLNPSPDSESVIPSGGTCAWSWWSDSSAPEDPAYEKKVADYAAELGCKWSLIDEGWEKWPDKWNQLKDICSHARERGVGIFVWKHQGQIADTSSDYLQLSEFLDSLCDAGVSGVKVDYFNGETKQLVDLQEKILVETSKRGLLVDFHGCQKPTGESRKYPNELTREGIRGLELNKMGQHLPANHNVALVFTRCISGNADYTPIGFSNPGATTWSHQLATAYAFTSPMTVLAESPEELVTNPAFSPALPFIKGMPTCWDETKVLPGSDISRCALLARRDGEKWYLVTLCGDKGMTIDVDLGFLGDGIWSGRGLIDADDGTFASCEKEISAKDRITIHLNDGGGAVWILEPADL